MIESVNVVNSYSTPTNLLYLNFYTL